MKGMTPPTVASGAFTGVSQTTISTVTVPAGALDAYLAQINAENSSAGLIRKKETMWNNLYLREEGSYAVEYYSEYVTGVKVAYLFFTERWQWISGVRDVCGTEKRAGVCDEKR